VPAARVGRHLPGTVDIAYSQGGLFSAPPGEALFLEVVGTQQIRVHARCRIAQPDKDDFVDVINETPVELDVSGAGADCTVSKLGDSGTIDVALRTGDGRTIATGTAGSWGGPSGTRLPTRFAFFKRRPHMPFPPGNPVPPLGNPTPALGNPVPAFQQSPVPPP
jgi:hypothetical protein